jgi:hypothetical protein
MESLFVTVLNMDTSIIIRFLFGRLFGGGLCISVEEPFFPVRDDGLWYPKMDFLGISWKYLPFDFS